MKISRLKVQRFTAFEDAEFVFAPGVNVLIGENGTGKSHVWLTRDAWVDNPLDPVTPLRGVQARTVRTGP